MGKEIKKRQYDKIGTYFALNKRTVFFLVITGLLFDGLSCIIPVLQGNLIQAFSDGATIEVIIRAAAIFFGFVAFIQLNRFLKRWFTRDFSNKMVLTMREVSFKNLLHDDISVFSTQSKGDIMNKNLSDIKDSADGVRKVTTEFFDTVVLLVGYFVTMFVLDYVTTLIVLGVSALSVLLSFILKNRIVTTTRAYKQAYGRGKDVTLSVLKNEVYYRGFGASDYYYKEFERQMTDVENKTVKNLVYKNSFEPVYYAIALLGLIFIIYFNGMRVIDGRWEIGVFSSYLATYMLVAKKASKLGKTFNSFATAKVSWQRCKPYLITKTEPKKIIINQSNELCVNNMSFGFDESFSVKNISFSARAGEIIGICGKVRSGKSTVGAALSGLYDYDGSIKLCGLELKEVKDDIIDDFISYAPGITEIFQDTLENNITFGKSGDVRLAVKDAMLEEDVQGFADKQNEIMSHSLLNISGGQQRRLQIARSLFNNPKLIILDDPFNAIDLATSIKMINKFKADYKSSIFVIINNQKESLRLFDKILFLYESGYSFSDYDGLLKNSQFKELTGE